jgi:hypothetical protein
MGFFGKLSVSVKPRKILFIHDDFAPDLDQLRNSPAKKTQRDGIDRLEIQGDIFANHAIPSGRALHNSASLINHFYGKPVELGFRRVRHCFDLSTGVFQDPPVEIEKLRFGRGLVKTEHRQSMSDRFEGLERRGSYSLSRRVRRNQFGISALQLCESVEEAVIFRISDLRLIQHVVKVIVAVDFFPESPDRIYDFRIWLSHA